MTAVYRASAPFRRSMTARRLEDLLPTMTDYAAVSASAGKSDFVQSQREAAAQWFQAVVDLSKLPSAIVSQVGATRSHWDIAERLGR